VKKFENQIIVGEVMAKRVWCLVFLTHGVVRKIGRAITGDGEGTAEEKEGDR